MVFTIHTLAAISVLIAVVGCAEYCDDRTWYKYGENCFSFESGEKYRLSYYDAEDYCRTKGAHLASIHSEEEALFLTELVESRYGGRRWVGLNTLDENEYKWSDETSFDYFSFHNKTQYKKEECYILYNKGSFRPEHCELRYYPICKRPSNVEPKPIPPLKPVVKEGNCPQDWLQFGQRCFKFFGANTVDHKKFKDAKQSCISLGQNHDLASIHNADEQAFLTEQMANFGSSVWIGFSHVDSDEVGQILVFGWTDNSRVDYTNWRAGHPLRGTWKNCARLQYDGAGKGEWVSDYCDINPRGYICERLPDKDLPVRPTEQPNRENNSTEFRGSFYTFHESPKSWFDAEETCAADGGHLVSVADGFEQAFLSRVFQNNAEVFWTGLRHVKGSKLLRWSDNQPLYYTKFSNLQNVTTSSDKCVLINTADDFSWDISDCYDKRSFICKSSNKTLPIPDEDKIGRCESKESALIDIGDEFCYHIGEGNADRYRWGQLVRYCLVRGMEMVTLTNSHQVKSILAYGWQKPYDFWLGLIRGLDKKSFMWMDQSELNYTDWKEREPSSWSSDKDCVSFSTSDGKWTVEDCNEWRGTICRAYKFYNK